MLKKKGIKLDNLTNFVSMKNVQMGLEVEVTSTPYFTENLVIEILSRLPVKSLLKFRCVSKNWHALIKTYYFFSIHHNNLKLRCLNQKLMRFCHETHQTSFNIFGFSLLDEEGTISTADTPDFFRNHGTKYMVGSSNGLVCLEVVIEKYKCDDIIVWNPATKQYRYLPKPVTKTKFMNVASGLDFIDDYESGYKLVTVFEVLDNDGRRVDENIGHGARVFSQATNCWRELEGLPPCSCRSSSLDSIMLNGVLYWLRINHDYGGDYVFSFNLRNEVFHAMQVPSYVVGGYEPLLFSFKNLPAVWYDYLWMMTTSVESTQVTWTKKYSSISLPISGSQVYILGVWKDQFLCTSHEVEEGEALLSYCPETKKWRKLSHELHVGRVYHDAVDYVESLLPV